MKNECVGSPHMSKSSPNSASLFYTEGQQCIIYIMLSQYQADLPLSNHTPFLNHLIYTPPIINYPSHIMFTDTGDE